MICTIIFVTPLNRPLLIVCAYTVSPAWVCSNSINVGFPAIRITVHNSLGSRRDFCTRFSCYVYKELLRHPQLHSQPEAPSDCNTTGPSDSYKHLTWSSLNQVIVNFSLKSSSLKFGLFLIKSASCGIKKQSNYQYFK